MTPPGSPAGPGTWISSLPAALHCQVGISAQESVLAGHGVCPMFFGVAHLTSPGTGFLPSLEKLMCRVAWGRLKCRRKLDSFLPKGMHHFCLSARAWLSRSQGSPRQWKTLEAAFVCFPSPLRFLLQRPKQCRDLSWASFQGQSF